MIIVFRDTVQNAKVSRIKKHDGRQATRSCIAQERIPLLVAAKGGAKGIKHQQTWDLLEIVSPRNTRIGKVIIDGILRVTNNIPILSY